MMELYADKLLWLENTIKKTEKKFMLVRERSAKKIPATCDDAGVHDNRADIGRNWNIDDGINWWTNGFWAGIMWQLYSNTTDKRYMEIARFTENKLDECFNTFYGLHHDLGFMWIHSALADYKQTGCENAKRRACHAANLLAGRYNPEGRFIRAWNNLPGSDTRGWVIIDSMLNIPLLFWASEESEDPRFKLVAQSHADTVLENFIRDDGSVRHIVEFNPNTGEYVKEYGGQGYAQGSAWTRGQAWGINGFAQCYGYTYEPRYLMAAEKIAHYFIENLPESMLVPVDFRQPKEPEWEDSIAAVVASSAFIDLAKYIPDKKEYYLNIATKIIKTLTEKRCDWSENTDCILTHCSPAYHSEIHNASYVYADYYFIESIYKLKGEINHD